MNSLALTHAQETALATVREQFEEAVVATKCHGCGCLADTLAAMKTAAPAIPGLAPILSRASDVVGPRKYDCLGCGVCYPAVAANALAEAFPETTAEVTHCPTSAPSEREGWPPLPGDYSVVRYGAAVAVCTLNSAELAKALASMAPEGLAIVGTLHTENLGIERVVRNVLGNPNIRFLLLCGEDTQQQVGHLPGQSMTSLFANGLDERQRIIGAKGKRPFVKNLSAEQVRLFMQQVELVAMIGEQDITRIAGAVRELHARQRPAFSGRGVADTQVEMVRVQVPQFYKPDPAGFFVVYPDGRDQALVVEHYSNAGVLDCVLAGATPTALYAEIVKRGLVSQLDHAAYLGRELAKAEHSLRTGEAYVQDRAPGEPLPDSEPRPGGSCGPGCGSCH